MTTTVASRTALAALTVPPTDSSAFLTEARREGPFVWSSSNHSADVTADPQQGVYVAPASDTTGASGAWVRPTHGILQAEWFGAIGDGTTDNLTALNAVRDFNNHVAVNAASNLRGGNIVRFGLGSFYLSDTWDVKGCTFILEGEGAGMAGGESTELLFAADKTGIRLQQWNTEGTGTGTTVPYGNDGSVIRNIVLRSLGGTSSGAHGIWARCRFEAHDVHIIQFPGNGCNIVATHGSGGSTEGNANDWLIRGGRVENCGGHGLYVSGADVNAGSCDGTDFTLNHGWGVYDDSFLGNGYANLHAATNSTGPFKADGLNQVAVFLNCYSESDQSPSIMAQHCMCLGGLHGAGVTGTFVRGYFGSAGCYGGYTALHTAAGKTTTVQVGTDASDGYIMTASYTDYSAFMSHRFRGADIVWGIGNADVNISHLWTGLGTGFTFGRPVGAENVHAFASLALGSDFTNNRIIDAQTSAPSATGRANGEWSFNINGSVGGPGFWTIVSGAAQPVGIIGATQATHQSNAAAATATSVATITHAPSQTDFNGLVTQFNKLVTDHANLLSSFNALLSALQTAKQMA